MRRLLMVCIATLLWMGGGAPSAAQSTADAYFHKAAKEYVAGNTEGALRAVRRGLERAPTNSKLLALKEKLQGGRRTRGPGNQAGSSSTNASSSRGNTSSNESSETGQSPSGAQADGQDSDARQSPSSQRDQRHSDSSDARAMSSDQERVASNTRGRGTPIDTLNRVQAERLLRALEGQERRLLQQLRMRSVEPQTVEKDW